MRVEHDINLYLEEGDSIEALTAVNLLGHPYLTKADLHRADHIRVYQDGGLVAVLKDRDGLIGLEEHKVRLI